MTHIYRTVVAYDGTDYSGFQIQRNRPTIQGEIESALERITQSATRIVGAGRTDAGVHACGQVISFGSAWAHSPAELERALNAVLPKSISVSELAVADDGFHARYSARGRTYRYQIYTSQTRLPLADRYALGLGQGLHMEPVRQATAHLLGRHDFAAFGQPPSGANTVRTVRSAEWHQIAPQNPRDCTGGAQSRLCFEIEADAFLRGMVRRLVGNLLWVGQGRLSPAEFREILQSREISRSAPPASAQGLCLWQVAYPDGYGARAVNSERV